jgi:hypothetical protein
VDQFYFEEGYFEGRYFGYIASAELILAPYLVEGYIDADYYFTAGGQSVLVCLAQTFRGVDVFAQGAFAADFVLSALAQPNTKLANANFDVISTLTAQAQPLIKDAFAELSVSVSLSGTISHIEGADLFAFSESQLALEVSVIRDNNISASVAFDIATDGRVFRDLASAPVSLFDFVAANERSRAFQMETQTAFSLTADAVSTLSAITNTLSEFALDSTGLKVTVTSADLSAEFSQQVEPTYLKATRIASALVVSDFALAVDAEKIAGTDIAIASEFVQDSAAVIITDITLDLLAFAAELVIGDRNRTVAADLSCQSEVTAEVFRIKQFEIDLQALAFKLSTAQASRQVIIDLASVFAQTATVSVILGTTCNIASEFAIAVVGNRLKDIDLVAFTDAAVSADITVIKQLSSDISSDILLVVDNGRIRTFAAQTESVSAQVSVASEIQSYTTAMASITVLTASVNANFSTSASVELQSTTVAVIGKLQFAVISISSALQFIAAVRDLRLDEIVYVIPGENYVYEIISETRLHDIYGETRIRSVTGESRNRRITGESRIHIID